MEILPVIEHWLGIMGYSMLVSMKKKFPQVRANYENQNTAIYWHLGKRLGSTSETLKAYAWLPL